MKNIYSPEDIDRIMAATIGNLSEADDMTPTDREVFMNRRQAFIDTVGLKVAAEVLANRKDGQRVVVFAGDDICGAYALSTARQLHQQLCPAEVYLINIGGNLLKADTVIARDKFLDIAGDEFLFETIDLNLIMPEMDEHLIIVDGLFGREYTSPLRGGYQAMARSINETGAKVISIDLPSGMSTELSVGMINRNIVHADITLTIVGPTLAFYMPENAELLGKWKTLQLPLNRSAVKSTRCAARLIDAAAIRSVLAPRDEYASKADLGHALIFAGSYGMLGAAVLSTRAACRSGCGKVTCHGPRCGFYTMQTTVPSAMFKTDGGDFDIRNFEADENYDAIAVGPGIGRSNATVSGLDVFLKACHAEKRPLILDADALNCIASRPVLLDFIPPRSIITPHPGEFDRLFGPQPSASARLLKAIEMSHKYKLIIVLKSHFTQTVWYDGSILVNSSGTEALATAGSGDVLTGLTAGFVAQQIAPEIAAVAAVFIHGVAGKAAACINGIRGTTAEDIADAIGPAIDSIIYPEKDS